MQASYVDGCFDANHALQVLVQAIWRQKELDLLSSKKQAAGGELSKVKAVLERLDKDIRQFFGEEERSGLMPDAVGKGATRDNF